MKQKQADAESMREKTRKDLRNLVLVLILAAGAIWGVSRFLPQQSAVALQTVRSYAIEMVMIFPPILILMGLIDVWVPQETIKRQLGRQSGWRGVLLSVFLGTLPTGPMFVAFPIAGEMLRKGARVANVVVFLGAWASLKMPQIGVEIQFLGLRFSALRVLLTFAAILAIGFITEWRVSAGAAAATENQKA